MTLTPVSHYGAIAKAMNQVQQHKPEHGELKGVLACPKCGGRLKFTIFANGVSMGHCPSRDCVRWQ